MAEDLSAGYLARVEASLIGVRPAPGAVFLRLSRDLASERRRTDMFIELTPGAALSLIQILQESVGIAIAADS